jgi:hypothetical protein
VLQFFSAIAVKSASADKQLILSSVSAVRCFALGAHGQPTPKADGSTPSAANRLALSRAIKAWRKCMEFIRRLHVFL